MDLDPERLDKIAGYRKETADVFEFIKSNGKRYDVVISDQNTNMDGEVWEKYERLKSMTRKYLIISVCWQNIRDGLRLPDGELLKRSDWRNGVYWHITKI